jgi:nitrite reductase/ring-hydroxylating ferredoxin subunit
MAASRNHPGEPGVHTKAWHPPLLPANPIEARGHRLVDIKALGARGVVEVRTTEHGILAVGITPDGTPFAVSDVCRHQFGRLGRGLVTEDGCLQCPWHRARFDVTDGTMVSGPKGRIFGLPPYSQIVRATANQFTLTTHPVQIREDAIWLRTES